MYRIKIKEPFLRLTRIGECKLKIRENLRSEDYSLDQSDGDNPVKLREGIILILTCLFVLLAISEHCFKV